MPTILLGHIVFIVGNRGSCTVIVRFDRLMDLRVGVLQHYHLVDAMLYGIFSLHCVCVTVSGKFCICSEGFMGMHQFVVSQRIYPGRLELVLQIARTLRLLITGHIVFFLGIFLVNWRCQQSLFNLLRTISFVVLLLQPIQLVTELLGIYKVANLFECFLLGELINLARDLRVFAVHCSIL